MASGGSKRRGGRPAKFAEPSRPVTVTLPERVLERLKTVSPDRAKAITTLVDTYLKVKDDTHESVETVPIAPGKAILLVSHSEALSRIPWLRLIAVAPAKHIISIQSGTSVDSMEVEIRDLLEELPSEASRDREILETLLRKIRVSRRGKQIAKEEILFVGLND